MGALALFLASGGLAALALPGDGKLIAVGLGLLALAGGLVAWRRPGARPRGRLYGAAAMTLGSAALLLGAAKVALTLIALDRLASLG